MRESTIRPGGSDSLNRAVRGAARDVAARDFLYDDPASFRAGVDEGIRAVLAVLGIQPGAVEPEDRAETA